MTTFSLERVHTVFQGDEQRDEDQARIAELEQLLGKATRQIEILIESSLANDTPIWGVYATNPSSSSL
jgi:hypothetical protein